MPPAEAKLWNLLRNDVFRAYHFRRQVPLGRYYADFASHTVKFVIEIDGDSHRADHAVSHDQARDYFIRSEGYRVERVSNLDVMTNLEGVGKILLDMLGTRPTRPGDAGPPSPRGGGRRVQAAGPEEDH